MRPPAAPSGYVRATLLVSATACLALLAGCFGEPADNAPTGGPAASSAPATRPASATATTSTSPSPEPAGVSTDSLLAAGQRAESQVSGAKLTAIATTGNRTSWAVTVTAADGTRSELTLTGDGSGVTSAPKAAADSASAKATNARELKGATLGYSQAVAKLQAAVPQVGIRELTLDTQDGKSVWEGNVSDGATLRDVVLDAGTGAVLSNKIDS